MNIDEFDKDGISWVWNRKISSKLGEFELELLDYSNSPSIPDSRMLERAEHLVACLAKDEAIVCNIVFQHYQKYCNEHPAWMAQCGVPIGLSEKAVSDYIYGLVAYVALDDGYEFDGYLIHPNWESEHKITFEYQNGKLEVQS